ncbi:6807_t:CDS:1 [Entrophospora sp. SA101]|nr:6807_t:CDS:1 [Entrophospora sp. SA101]CAJ0840202.1 16220_t:CDS:1 [Entrophospora sp. SA101]
MPQTIKRNTDPNSKRGKRIIIKIQEGNRPPQTKKFRTTIENDMEDIEITFGNINNQDTKLIEKDKEIITPLDDTTSLSDTVPTKNNTLIEFQTRKTAYVAIAPYDTVKGKTTKDKYQSINKIFNHLDNYTGPTIKSIKKDKFIAAFFNTPEDLKAALEIDIPILDKEPYRFLALDNIKQSSTQEAVTDEKSRTIQVIDIRLGTPTSTVRAKFSKFGEIENITPQTRNFYQHAL